MLAARSGWKLRREVRRSGELVRHSGSCHGAAIAVAERLCRALGRVDPTRVLRSCNRPERVRFAARPEVLLRLLRAISDSPVARQRRADQSTDSTCDDGSRRGNPASWRTPSSIRAPRGLSHPRIHIINSGIRWRPSSASQSQQVRIVCAVRRKSVRAVPRLSHRCM